MKRSCLVLIFVSLAGLLAFGNAGEQEEIDFLLFLPNSGNRFVNEDRAMIQLDNVADYLLAKNVSPGQIAVHGYAAAVVNDIDSVHLSKDRALYVINELQKRGLPGKLFAEPVAGGSVDLWATDEGDRSLNRRGSILVDGIILNPAAVQTINAGAKTPPMGNNGKVIWDDTATEKTGFRIPWRKIFLALIGLAMLAAIIFFAVGAVPPGKKTYILSEEEIRCHAYDLYEHHYDQNEDAVKDWHQSVEELTANYEDQGYRVMLYWEVQA